MRWQKPARFVIALFIVAFAGVVIVSLRRSSRVTPPAEIVKFDDKPVMQTSGGSDWKRLDKAGKVVFAIHCETQKIYEDGRTVCERSTLTLPDRDGRTITITSDSADGMPAPQGSAPAATKSSGFSTAVLKGNVKLHTSDDLTVTCAEATYSDTTGILAVPGPVNFTRGRMTGSGKGATYDQKRDVLWILAEARIAIAADPSGGGKLDASSGTAGLARADHYVRLSQAAHVVADNRTIDADDITANLTPDDQKITLMQLRGHSHIVGTGPSAQDMAAKDIDLTYGPDGRTLQQSKLMEDSVLRMPADGGRRHAHRVAQHRHVHGTRRGAHTAERRPGRRPRPAGPGGRSGKDHQGDDAGWHQ